MGSMLQTVGLALGAGKTSAPQGNLGGEVSDMLAQAPAMYQNAATYAPQYQDLMLQMQNAYLNGSNGQPGYLQQYTQNVLPAMTAASNTATTSSRASTFGDLASMGPGAASSLKALNPDVASLYGKLAQQAGEGLDAGSMLTADQQRNVNNAVRAGQSARGMAFGPTASYQEVLANSQYGDQLLQQRQGFAGQVADMGNSLYSQPLLQYFGLGSNAPMGAAGNVMASGNSGEDTALSASNTVGQLGTYASSLNRNNQDLQWKSNYNNAAQQYAMWSSAGNSLNTIGASFI